MASESEDRLPLRRIYTSLARRIMVKGGERELVYIVILLGIMVGFVDSVGFGPWFGVPLGAAVGLCGLWVARRMGKADPFMTLVARRALRYRRNYPARGRPAANVPKSKSFR
ncbi:VirB3 family type IV secretion system protein (plasmid) [Achromobacter sp. CF-sbj1-Ac2-l]|jgi:type IV secretion system protein VirB3|uniref:VirB3 family type IV secretion system protein n=1 Tax=Achromobacter TaxID=222 RepID=UPI0009E805F7|nr:VirB3 family type IV secretion system protein [Achromobacter xylosoxidans]